MFFIKVFKPIHILMAMLITYLIYISNKILVFFNNYIYSNQNIVGTELNKSLISSFLFIIPIMILVFSLIFLGVMFHKKKPVAFYVINIFVYLVVIFINFYISNFLISMEESIISIKIVKLGHDLILLNMIFQIISFVFMLARGLGLNFKKFNFESDVTNFNISDEDKEEIELNLNIDLQFAKSKRKRKLRYFKYIYKENNFLINLSIGIFLIIFILTIMFIKFYKAETNKEGIVYSMNNFNLRVNNTIFLDSDINNQKVTDNYLIIVDVSLQTKLTKVSLFLKDFTLEVGESIFHPETKYSNKLLDIGNSYKEQILTSNYSNYIFVFEVPKKYIESDFLFVYNNQGIKSRINLNPKKYISKEIVMTSTIGNELNFSDTLGKTYFTINSFEIRDKFLIKYNYCVKDNDCIESKEYIVPTINTNFDKYILRLDVKYNDESDLNINKFYDFFLRFGVIEYKIGDKTYIQNTEFEELKSKKIDNKNNVYIGVNSNISNADHINLIFNIRGSRYTYIIK